MNSSRRRPSFCPASPTSAPQVDHRRIWFNCTTRWSSGATGLFEPSGSLPPSADRISAACSSFRRRGSETSVVAVAEGVTSTIQMGWSTRSAQQRAGALLSDIAEAAFLSETNSFFVGEGWPFLALIAALPGESICPAQRALQGRRTAFPRIAPRAPWVARATSGCVPNQLFFSSHMDGCVTGPPAHPRSRPPQTSRPVK